MMYSSRSVITDPPSGRPIIGYCRVIITFPGHRLCRDKDAKVGRSQKERGKSRGKREGWWREGERTRAGGIRCMKR